jgi:CcmD family protein
MYASFSRSARFSVFLLALVSGVGAGPAAAQAGDPTTTTLQESTTPGAAAADDPAGGAAAADPPLDAEAVAPMPNLRQVVQAPGTFTQTAQPPRTLRAYWHLFIAFAVTWLLLFGYALSVGRRWARLEREVQQMKLD